MQVLWTAKVGSFLYASSTRAGILRKIAEVCPHCRTVVIRDPNGVSEVFVRTVSGGWRLRRRRPHRR